MVYLDDFFISSYWAKNKGSISNFLDNIFQHLVTYHTHSTIHIWLYSKIKVGGICIKHITASRLSTFENLQLAFTVEELQALSSGLFSVFELNTSICFN